MTTHRLIELRAGADRLSVSGRARLLAGDREPWYEVEIAAAFAPFAGTATGALAAEDLQRFARELVDGGGSATLGGGRALALHLSVGDQVGGHPDRRVVEAALTMSEDDPHPRLHGLLFDQPDFAAEAALAIERLLAERPGPERDATPSPGLVPELLVRDPDASRDFYIDRCGFEVLYERPEERFVYLRRGTAELMLEPLADDGWITAELAVPFGRGISFEIETPDVDGLHDWLVMAGVALFRPLHDAWYRRGLVEVGNRQFLVQDPDGYLLRFARDLGTRPVAPATGAP